jgi:uncharacterized protein (DUF58 family)
VFWISDFEDPVRARDWRVLGRRHDVTAMLLRDPRDEVLPAVGWVELEDLERNTRVLVNTSSHRVRERYAREARERRLALERAMSEARCPLLELHTDRSYLPVLLRFFGGRKRGRAA